MAIVLTAGCVGKGEEGISAASTGATDQGAGAPASAAGSAPSSETAGEAAAEAANASAAPVVTRVSVDVAGSLPAFVEPCVFTPVVGECQALPPAEFNNRFEVDAKGNLTHLVLTLEWSAASPSTEELGMSFHSFTDGEFVMHGHAFGPSPLVLEIADPIVLAEGWTHRIGVGAGGPAVNGEVVFASATLNAAEQPFTVKGELSVLAPPNP